MKYFVILLCLLFIACSREIIITEEDIKQDLLYLNNEIKPFSGICKVLFSDTFLLKEKFEFTDGMLDGKSCSYYKDGSLKWRGTYEDGKMAGKWEFWDVRGIKYCEVYFNNDNYNGPFKLWHSNGKLKETGQYSNNHKTGKWTTYDEAGNVITDSVY
jgi:antitoxin component YwqK of YwqJK toxin-antitoxin module